MKSREKGNLILELDSSNAVLWSNSNFGGPWNINHHLNFIRNACKKYLNIQVIHKSRDFNFVAHTLAKQGLLKQKQIHSVAIKTAIVVPMIILFSPRYSIR